MRKLCKIRMASFEYKLRCQCIRQDTGWFKEVWVASWNILGFLAEIIE